MALDQKKILVLGDSLTQRGFDPSTNGWVASLASFYIRRCDVINRGFSGFNSKHVRIIFPKLKIPELELAVVFIGLLVLTEGVNDSVLASNAQQHVSLDEYKSNMKDVISLVMPLCKQHMVIVSPTPCNQGDWEEYRKLQGRDNDRSLESTRQYHLACIEIAKEHNIPVVDTWKLFGGHDSDLFVDGVHFSAKGNDLIFKAVRDAVVAHYPKTLDPEQMETFLPWWDTPNLDAVLENM